MSAVATAPSTKTPTNVNLRDLIRDTLAANIELSEAESKLQKLYEDCSQVQAQLNELPNQGTQQLADAILAGETLDSHEATEIKRATLTKRIEAYNQAIAKQKQLIDEKRAAACEDVEAAVAPVHAARWRKVQAAIAALEKANGEFEETQAALSQYRIRHKLAFNGLQQIRTLTGQLALIAKK